ncbi:hypothetical protein LX36DRAFT_715174 [Colletotrichum falcatum]|nr:hypothetical protein LX36DRAFT_715174 [Colletotrichum falcatum]
MTILSAPGPDAESVLSVANTTDFGLGVSIFGQETYAVQLPFGGVDGSRYGRFAGEAHDALQAGKSSGASATSRECVLTAWVG